MVFDVYTEELIWKTFPQNDEYLFRNSNTRYKFNLASIRNKSQFSREYIAFLKYILNLENQILSPSRSQREIGSLFSSKNMWHRLKSSHSGVNWHSLELGLVQIDLVGIWAEISVISKSGTWVQILSSSDYLCSEF